MPNTFDLLTEDDLAGMLGVSTATLAVWRTKKAGPDYVKLGKNVFYRARDINEWIDLNVVKTRRTAEA